MQITLFTGFSKREDSTLQPTGGTTKTVTLKEKTSIESPTFILAEALSNVSNVTAVLWDGRYYFVTDISSDHNGISEITCSIDRLATFKSQIGSSTQFIERSASGYSFELRDENVVTTAETFVKNTSGGSIFPSALSNGIIVVSVASSATSKASGGTAYLAYFDANGVNFNIRNLIGALYDNSVISSIEKILNKPYDAILAVRYIPGFTTTDIIATGNFSSSNIIFFGDYGYTIDNVTAYQTGPWTYTKSFEFDLDLVSYNSVYNWLNMEPYSSWSVFLPFYGTITIPAAEYIGNENGACNLKITVTVDLTTGELVYTRYRRVYVSGVATDYIAQEYRTTMGVDVPIQGTNRDMLSFASDIITGAGSVALMLASGGSAAGAVAIGASSGAKALIDIAQQNYNTAGSFNAHGTQIATAEPNTIYLTQTGYKVQTTPTNFASQIGAPLMKADQISNHSGYVKCKNASVSIPGTAADKAAVNAMLNSGFFYE